MHSFRSLARRFQRSTGPAAIPGTEQQAEEPKQANQNELLGDSKDNSLDDGTGVEEPAADAENQPGELTFAEDTAGGMGRHLGIFSATFLM